MMFDTTACGEYNSRLGRSQPCGGDDEEDEGEEEEEEDDGRISYFKNGSILIIRS